MMSATQLLKVNQGPVAVSLFRSYTEFRELLQILIVLFFERLHLCVSRDKVFHSRKVGVFDNRNLRADTDMQARCVSCCHREREFRGAVGANRAPGTRSKLQVNSCHAWTKFAENSCLIGCT